MVAFRTRTLEDALGERGIDAEVIDDTFNDPYFQMERNGRYLGVHTTADEVEVNMAHLMHAEVYGTRSLADQPWNPKDLTDAFSEVSTLEEFVELADANL